MADGGKIVSQYAAEVIEFDDYEEEEEYEPLPCSMAYVVVCLWLPVLNGCIHGFTGSVQTLYFRDNDWPLWRLGIAVACGFTLRLFSQGVQVQVGIWSALVMSLLHLIFAILASIFFSEEWAVILQLIALFGLDSSGAIEGIAFDAFAIEDFARQATSSALAVFTVTIAVACTCGAAIYESTGWQGMSILHCSLQGLLVLTLWIYPTCRESFWDWKNEWDYDSDSESDDDDDDDDHRSKRLKDKELKSIFPVVVYGHGDDEEDIPGATDLTVEDVEAEQKQAKQTEEDAPQEAAVDDPGVRLQQDEPAGGSKAPIDKQGSELEEDVILGPDYDAVIAGPLTIGRSSVSIGSQQNQFKIKPKGRRRVLATAHEGRNSVHSGETNSQRPSITSRKSRTRPSEVSVDEDMLSQDRQSARKKSVVSHASRVSRYTRGSRKTQRTDVSKRSGRSMRSMRSQLTSLADAGANFEHHFMVNSTLGPRIVTRTGHVEEEVESEPETVFDVPLPLKPGEIKKSARLPLMVTIFCGMCSSYCYSTELNLFALYFREQYAVTSPVVSAVGQTAGDFLAAGVLQAMALSSNENLPLCDKLSSILERLIFPPYSTSYVLAVWTILLGLFLVPSLAATIVAQVCISTAYCLCARWTMEVIFFYCEEEELAFTRMQVVAGQCQALAAALAGIVGLVLYDVHPTTPFWVSGSLVLVAFVLYTVFFLVKIGCQHVTLQNEEEKTRSQNTWHDG